MTVLDPLEHSGVSVHAEPVSHIFRGCTRKSPGMEEVVRETIRVRIVHSRTPRKQVDRAPPEDGEAIVVGAVGSAAPWFLTGWT